MKTSKTIAGLIGPTLVAIAASMLLNIGSFPELAEQVSRDPATTDCLGPMRTPVVFSILVLALPAFAQPVDFAVLERYGQACVRLKAAILTDSDEDLRRKDVVIGWIAECNGNIPACRDARDAIREAKKGSPLDCLGRVQSHEAASAAYSLYLDKASKLPRCIERRC